MKRKSRPTQLTRTGKLQALARKTGVSVETLLNPVILGHVAGNVYAREIGVSPQTLYDELTRLGYRPHSFWRQDHDDKT